MIRGRTRHFKKHHYLQQSSENKIKIVMQVAGKLNKHSNFRKKAATETDFCN
jgi:outer membrane receptor for ferric coprogen and ferric-rhodotorulic acid